MMYLAALKKSIYDIDFKNSSKGCNFFLNPLILKKKKLEKNSSYFDSTKHIKIKMKN